MWFLKIYPESQKVPQYVFFISQKQSDSIKMHGNIIDFLYHLGMDSRQWIFSFWIQQNSAPKYGWRPFGDSCPTQFVKILTLKKKLPTKRHEIKHNMFILLKKWWLMKGKQTTSLVSTSLFLDLLHSWPNPKLAQPLGGGRCAQLFQSM